MRNLLLKKFIYDFLGSYPLTSKPLARMQASTRGSPDMVTKWDTQVAMKPPAFDQDDHVQSQDQFLDIAVVSRGGRLNSGWKKVRAHGGVLMFHLI